MKTLAEWSRAVKERDGRCLNCGKVEDLHAHHVFLKSTHPHLRMDVENGRTLCYGCHKAEHERNRPIRIRSERPRRKTLEKQIEILKCEIEELNKASVQFRRIIRSLIRHGASCEECKKPISDRFHWFPEKIEKIVCPSCVENYEISKRGFLYRKYI